jgi:hypothetical protein
MTFDIRQPPARRRSRDGLEPLSWSKAPDASEAWPDKLRIEVRGRATWGEGGSFIAYLRRISPSSYLTAPPTVGRRYRAEVRYGTGVTGDLRINMVSQGLADSVGPGEARITLALNLNPTTTRALAVRRSTSSLADVTLPEFFKPHAQIDEAFGEGPFADRVEWALDKAENVMLSVAELGGGTSGMRASARDEFFALYENRLRSLAEHIVNPPVRDDDSFAVLATLDWGTLVLQQAEVYFERRADDPVAVVRRLQDRALDLARRVKQQSFADVPSDRKPVPTTYSANQDDEYPHLIVPLTGSRNIELSIYAKTNRRIRFEVRYRRQFGNHLRACSTGPDRLTSLVLRLTENASRRLPWRSLAGAAATPPDVDVGDIPQLIRHLVHATRRQPELFYPMVHRLVLTGGVVADEDRFPGVSKAIRELERLGVLSRWQTQQKEERANRRYGLSDRFAAVRTRMLLGFAPAPSAQHIQPEPSYLDDSYEKRARLAGGRRPA